MKGCFIALLIILIIGVSLVFILRNKNISYWHEYTTTVDKDGKKHTIQRSGWGRSGEAESEEIKRTRAQMQEQAQYWEKQRQYFEQQGKEMKERSRRFEEEMKSKGL